MEKTARVQIKDNINVGISTYDVEDDLLKFSGFNRWLSRF